MAIEAWRIVKEKYADNAFDGEGARLFGGRWNFADDALVYTSESLSLAALEVLVHLATNTPSFSLVSIKATIPDSVEVKTHQPSKLDITSCRQYGSNWVKGMSGAVLKVPSYIIPEEHNLLLNPNHDDFKKIEISEPKKFEFDKRLFK